MMMGINDWKFTAIINRLIALVYPMGKSNLNHHLLHIHKGQENINLEFKAILPESMKYALVKGDEIKVQERKAYFDGILMDITARKRMEEQVRVLKNNQQKLILSATLTAQEKERNKISSALHDSVCQILYGIKLNLESLERSNQLKGEFKNIYELLNQAIKETRHLSYELTPSVLKDFGFVAGIKEMAQRTGTRHFQIDTLIDPKADLLAADVQLYVFRMIQELINNCIKHAHATRAEVKVMLLQDLVTIRVVDNGDGLKMNLEEAIRNGSGLSGIKNRVYLLNGHLKFDHPGEGLAVTIIFNPLHEILL